MRAFQRSLKKRARNLPSSQPDAGTSVRVKICGLTSVQAVSDATDAGAAYLGFNFFQKSPRSITLAQAPDILRAVPPGVMKVALVVDPDDALVAGLSELPIDMVQLHGEETPDRVVAVRKRTRLPVMKVIGIRGPEDVAKIALYGSVSDQLLVDAKAPRDAELPGGNGVAFDWRLIAGQRWPVPWMLAGGLKPENVAEGIRLTGARQVDVASGVESAPGVKDRDLMRAFIRATQEDSTAPAI